MDQLRELWAIERQAIIDRLGSATANLSACPTGWSDTEGVEDGVIKLAATAPLSGVFISYGQSSAGMSEYFDQVNERGGIGPDGLQVELTVYDDAFDALRTEEIVDDLLAGDQPFAITTFGTPNTLAVYDSLNGACVPQPTVQSNHPAWSDPENHPWTTGLDMSLATEAWLWGAWIDENLPYPVTVGALVMDSDLGRIYEQAFAEHAATSAAIESVEFVRHDPTAPSVTDEMAAIAALDPTVFISMTAANPCLMAINAAAETGLAGTAEVLITPSMCTQVSAFLAPAGEAADGWLTFSGGFNDLVEPTARSGPYAEYVVDSLFEAGLDGNDILAADGFGKRAWTLHQILEVAANLEGGLTRSNLQLAQWRLNGMTHPSMIIGLEFGTSNTFIPSFVNGSGISRYDASSQSWSFEGLIDQTGIVPPCRWVPELGCA